MDIKIDIQLNQLGQGVISKTEGQDWFRQLSSAVQIEVLRRLVYFILQMGGSGRDAKPAIELSGLRKTYTPCQLLFKASEEPVGRKYFSAILTKIINLPESERSKSFDLLVSLFAVVDRNKREQGVCPEKYWWHRDLSKPIVVESIIDEFSD
jgi:hypothetical protein